MDSFPSLAPPHCPMSGLSCCFLACTQVSEEAARVVCCSSLLKNVPQFVVIHTVKGVVNNFLELFCFFYDPTDVGNLISGSSAFSKFSLYIWKFLVHVLLKPSLKDLEHYLACKWNECNHVVVWTFFGIALLSDLNESWLFPVLWPLLSFPNLMSYWLMKKYNISFHCSESHA